MDVPNFNIVEGVKAMTAFSLSHTNIGGERFLSVSPSREGYKVGRPPCRVPGAGALHR